MPELMTVGPSAFVRAPAFQQEQLPFETMLDDGAPTIGVIAPRSVPLGTSRTLDAIASAAAAEGYSGTLLPGQRPAAAAAAPTIQSLPRPAPAGVLILAE